MQTVWHTRIRAASDKLPHIQYMSTTNASIKANDRRKHAAWFMNELKVLSVINVFVSVIIAKLHNQRTTFNLPNLVHLCLRNLSKYFVSKYDHRCPWSSLPWWNCFASFLRLQVYIFQRWIVWKFDWMYVLLVSSASYQINHIRENFFQNSWTSVKSSKSTSLWRHVTITCVLSNLGLFTENVLLNFASPNSLFYKIFLTTW